MRETVCCLCKEIPVTATDDDETPMCEGCHGRWAESLAVRSIVEGEMDHIIPGLQGGEDDD